MDFKEAEQKRAQLDNRLRNQEIPQTAYTAAINNLRVTDSYGRIWQPDPGSSGWIVWNGKGWQAGIPPVTAAPVPTTQPGMQDVSLERAKDFGEFKDSLMTIDDFKKMSRDIPLVKRPQKWWDLLSILGGIVCAVIWVVYSGIREGIDIITPILMIAIPVCLVWFRTDIDRMLLPLQPYRMKVSRLVLIGCGLALPFLTAFILFSLGIRNYPLMYTNMIIGTFGAYILTRDPVTAPGQPPQRQRGALHAAISLIAGLAFLFLLVPAVRADDCARDILNAQDCLRTSGFAEAIAGLFSSLLSALVNGPVVIQSVVQGTAASATTIQNTEYPVPPPNARVGDTISFIKWRSVHTATLQADGRWLTDYDTYYDPDLGSKLADEARIDAANAAWRRDHAAQEAADAAKFKAMTDGWKAQMAKDKADLEKSSYKTWYRGYITREMARNQSLSDMYTAQGKLMETAGEIADWIKYGCDKSIDILGEVTGPAGRTIKTIYKVGTNVGESLGEGFAEGGNFKSHLAKGAGNAAVDLIGDKLTDKGFEKLGKSLKGHVGSGLINWVNTPIKVNPDPMAIRIVSPKTEIAVRGIGNAAKGWLKGWGPGYGTDAIKNKLIGK